MEIIFWWWITVADPDLELGVGPSFVLRALPVFLPSVISFFHTKQGEPRPPLCPFLDPPLEYSVGAGSNFYV